MDDTKPIESTQAILDKPIKRRGARKSKITGTLLPPKRPKKQATVNQTIAGNQHKGKLDVAQALKLRMVNHLSYGEIAKHFGVTDSAVCQRLQSHLALFDDPEIVSGYVENKEKVWASVESRFLVEALRPEKMDATSSAQAVMIAGISYDKQRLERGLSTDNISIRSVHGQIQSKLKELSDKRDKLASELNALGDVGTSDDPID